MVTGCYVPFHSLDETDLGDEGVKSLGTALSECHNLKHLR